MISYSMEYTFGQLGSAVLAVSPPSSLIHSQPNGVWEGGKCQRVSLDAVQVLVITSQNTGVLSVLFCYNSKAQRRLWRNTHVHVSEVPS